VQARLRAALAPLADVPPAALATALAYELASLIARQSPDLTVARQAVHHFAALQITQLGAFGVGTPHP
jgi:hypothetical protein